jgi:hypothetical protein
MLLVARCRIDRGGYLHDMPETPRQLMHDVVEEVKSLEHEAEEGKTARTPLLVLGGITGVVSVIFVVLVTGALLAYYLTK